MTVPRGQTRCASDIIPASVKLMFIVVPNSCFMHSQDVQFKDKIVHTKLLLKNVPGIINSNDLLKFELTKRKKS